MALYLVRYNAHYTHLGAYNVHNARLGVHYVHIRVHVHVYALYACITRI